MELDIDYVKGTESWLKSMDVSMEQTKNMIDFHEKEIELHTKFVGLYKEQLMHDENRYAKAKADFEDYLKENQ